MDKEKLKEKTQKLDEAISIYKKNMDNFRRNTDKLEALLVKRRENLEKLERRIAVRKEKLKDREEVLLKKEERLDRLLS